jgi:mRNA interferase MazF
MIAERQVVLFQFPQNDQHPGKIRPALIIRKLPGIYDDWLICMISSENPFFTYTLYPAPTSLTH